jgi:hypothetical protein
VTFLPVKCTSISTFTESYAKIVDLDRFDKQDADSTLEVTFNGRIAVSGSMDGTGAVFELRVDNAPPKLGWARASLKKAELGTEGAQVSITGVFPSVSAGTHTVSIWMRGMNGGGRSAWVDNGCWSSDYVIVREFK